MSGRSVPAFAIYITTCGCTRLALWGQIRSTDSSPCGRDVRSIYCREFRVLVVANPITSIASVPISLLHSKILQYPIPSQQR